MPTPPILWSVAARAPRCARTVRRSMARATAATQGSAPTATSTSLATGLSARESAMRIADVHAKRTMAPLPSTKRRKVTYCSPAGLHRGNAGHQSPRPVRIMLFQDAHRILQQILAPTPLDDFLDETLGRRF